MVPQILLAALLLSIQSLHTAQSLLLSPSPHSNNTIDPTLATTPDLMPRGIFYDIPGTELTLCISDLFRRIDNQVGHDLLRLATQEAQSAVTRGRGDLPLKPRCWAVERGGYRLEIHGGGPSTGMTVRQMSYEMLLEVVKGLGAFFSEVRGAYYLLIFSVLARGSRKLVDGYGVGRLMNMREGVEQSGKLQTLGCIENGAERPAEAPLQVDRLVR